MTRHVFTIDELSDESLASVLALATSPFDDETLKGQGVALVFEYPSLRTRASCSSAVSELGGFTTFFSDDEIGLDRRESAEDVARTIAQMYAIAGLRLRRHEVFERMRHASDDQLSLINLLSERAHPTQAIADVLTIAEEFTHGDVTDLRGLQVAYVGDATNVTRSLAVALVRLGARVRIGAPSSYQLTPGGPEDPFRYAGPGSLQLCESAAEAVRGANVVYTDAWVSMGAESESTARREALAGFRVDANLLALAAKDAVVLHCLPAHRGDEITNDVLDGPQSRVWRQVAHRRTAMRGVLRWIKGES